jgi:hypothetical protein
LVYKFFPFWLAAALHIQFVQKMALCNAARVRDMVCEQTSG